MLTPTAGYLKFIKDPGSGQGADGDILGTITFFGTDASNNAPEELARMESSVVEADHGSEAGAIKFYVAENDATMTAGLQILGQATADGEIDVNHWGRSCFNNYDSWNPNYGKYSGNDYCGTIICCKPI